MRLLDGAEDIHYRPLGDGLTWVKELHPERCVLLGTPTTESLAKLSETGAELRTHAVSHFAKVLHEGVYALRVDQQWSVLLVPEGLPASVPASVRERYAEGYLGTAVASFPLLWAQGTPHSGSCQFSVDDLVRPRGQQVFGRVTRVAPRSHGYDIYVMVDGTEKQFSEHALELADGNPADPSFWIKEKPATAEEIAFTLTWTKLRHPLTDTLYSFASSKTVFRPYQFVPVLKLLSSSSGRLLIADEVGLGKTIEAGLIWSELEQRDRLDRVLVVTPASLTLKWQSEMRRRFDRELQLLRPADLAEFALGLEQGRDPRLQGVISIQALRGAGEVLERLGELGPHLDLVIVDEAHSMRNRGTSTHLLGQMLSDWADVLIFLSATPLNLGRDDLFNLMNLLAEDEFADRHIFGAQLEPNRVLNQVARSLVEERDRSPHHLLGPLDTIDHMELGSAVTQRPDYTALRDLLDRGTPLGPAESAAAKRLLAELNTLSSVFTRTRKVDVPDTKAVRQAEQVDVAWTDAEYGFYLAVQRAYVQRAARSGVPPGFAMQMPLRQAASCIPAMQALIREKNPELLAEVDDVDDGADESADESTNWPLEQLDATSDLARPLERDSKFEALRERLIEARANGMGQVMVFSFFRRTLTYLAERLGTDFSVRVMTGATAMAERQIVMEDFRAGKFEILLLSQVGSEGLDFEFCNVLVNYDLPWNPMQVEQRIGRLDRFGQQHEKIFIFNMHVPGTIETDIFQRLYDRIGVFKESIGELEPILRDDFRKLTGRLLDPRLSPEERARRTHEVGVALEGHKQDVQRLSESHGLLSTIDQLKIDGLTEGGPSEGRFIGQSEVRRLLDRLLNRLGGKLSQPGVDGICKLVGSTALAHRLRAGGIPGRGSMYAQGKLAAMLRDGDSVPVTFDTDVASKHNVELLSSRHPLVALAMNEFGAEALSLKRFGAVRVPGIPPGARYVARVDLAESSGLRPRVELWVTAVDQSSGTPSEQVGMRLLTALAGGELEDLKVDGVTAPPHALRAAELLVSDRRRSTEDLRARENVALVDARIASKRRSIELKIHRAELLRGEAIRGGKASRIIRLHEGRARNLRSEMASVVDDLSPRKELSLALTQVALLVVEGT